jgi:hypothetical protein
MAHFVARMLIGHHTDEGARNAPGCGLHCELPHNARPRFLGVRVNLLHAFAHTDVEVTPTFVETPTPATTT